MTCRETGDCEGEVVAFARRKVMSAKEEVTVYTDESRTSVLCTSGARRLAGALDLGHGAAGDTGANRPRAQMMSSDRKFGLRDRYVLDIGSADTDRRLAIAQAVALDTLEDR